MIPMATASLMLWSIGCAQRTETAQFQRQQEDLTLQLARATQELDSVRTELGEAITRIAIVQKAAENDAPPSQREKKLLKEVRTTIERSKRTPTAPPKLSDREFKQLSRQMHELADIRTSAKGIGKTGQGLPISAERLMSRYDQQMQQLGKRIAQLRREITELQQRIEQSRKHSG